MRNTVFGATIAFTVAFSGCGDGVGDATTGAGPSGTPTPAATASATATPTPAPSANATCQLPKLPNCDAQCCSEGGSVIYANEIDTAQRSLRTKRPELFIGNNVRNNFEYLAELAQEIMNLSGGQICAEPLAHDEMRVKGDQNVSQHVDVLIADVTPWVGGAYTCRPASF